MFYCSRNAHGTSFLEKTKLKIISLVFKMINNDNTFRVTVVNRALEFLYGGSREITLTFPL